MSTLRTIEELQKLRETTENIVGDLVRLQREGFNVEGNANWADLHCVGACFYMDQSGACGNEVLIQEADPSNEQLSKAINRALVCCGYSRVEIVFEW